MPDQNRIDAIALLKADHRKVEDLFAEFKTVKGAAKKRGWSRKFAPSSVDILLSKRRFSIRPAGVKSRVAY